MNTISSLYAQAHRRLFLLDYDGTLAPLAPTPQQATPTPELLALLERLSADPNNTVVIISGRDRQTLDEWLGHLPLSFAAEHGFVFKHPGDTWAPVRKTDSLWKESVRERLEQAVNAVPGSFIEEKGTALCWHYRQAKSKKAAKTALEQLRADLPALCKQLDLRCIYGSMVVEVQPSGIDKGVAASYWLSLHNWDFILAAGDDTTDEDLFAVCPPAAITLKVGPPPTAAGQTVDSVQLFTALLHELAAN